MLQAAGHVGDHVQANPHGNAAGHPKGLAEAGQERLDRIPAAASYRMNLGALWYTKARLGCRGELVEMPNQNAGREHPQFRRPG